VILGQRIINAILRPAVELLLDYDVEGQENLPREGPVVVIMNHTNFVDVVLPAMFLPRDVVMLSKVENFRVPVLRVFVRVYGSLPVRRGEADLRAMRLSLTALKKGQVLVIAPEGTRSEDGRLQPARKGAALVAAQAGVPVVPFVMYGHQNLARNLQRLRRTPLHIRVGKPFRFVTTRRPRRDELQAMTEEAMARLAALLPPEYRGVCADSSCVVGRYTEPCPPPAGAEGT
jgi:1-acyl-sn-glycerol-3-phosphate acyltransferase